MKSKVIFILLAVMAGFSGTSFAKKIYQYRDYSFIEHYAPHHPQTMGSRMIHVVLDYSHLLTLNDQSVRYGNPEDLYRQYFAFYQKALLQDFGVELKSRDQHNIQRSVIAYRLLRQVDKLMGQAHINNQFHNISHHAGVNAADQWILNESFKQVQQEFNYFLSHKAIRPVAPKKVYRPIFNYIPGNPLRAVQGNEHPHAIAAMVKPAIEFKKINPKVIDLDEPVIDEPEIEEPVVEAPDCEYCLMPIEDDQTGQTMCRKKYHKDCLNDWLEKNHTCPNCRKDKLNSADDDHFKDEKKSVGRPVQPEIRNKRKPIFS